MNEPKFATTLINDDLQSTTGLFKLINTLQLHEDYFALFHSGESSGNLIPAEYNWILFIGSENKVEIPSFYNHEYSYGHIAYDYKNQLENLVSTNSKIDAFEEVGFHYPEVVIQKKQGRIEVVKGKESKKWRTISELFPFTKQNPSETTLQFRPTLSKEQYLQKIEALRQHLQRGDIYEINFCQLFEAQSEAFNPADTYKALIENSPAPFSCFYKQQNAYLLSISPERFFCKRQDFIYSQPIKGTVKRMPDSEADKAALRSLFNGNKNRTENVMIVDLVRNDLSKIAKRSSVFVPELYGIYSYPFVHQMISTVGCEIDKRIDLREVIKALFPMGSMTGAPKISAMQLIEHYENFKRGLFSGSVGFVTPNGDADFNVVIRSILYNENTAELSLPVGGAITMQSDAEDEYEETLIKAASLLKVLPNAWLNTH